MKKKQDLILALQKKQSTASVTKVNTDEITDEYLEGLFETQGLFLEKQIVTLSQICDQKDQWEVVKKKLKDLAESDDVILWSEIHSKPLAPLKKKIESIKKVATKTAEAIFKETSRAEVEPNMFDFAGQYYQLNKKELWVVFQKIRDEVADGDVPLNMLLWQTRAILQSRAESPEAAGLKPFVYKKSRKYLDKWGEEKIKDELVELTKNGQEMRMDKKKGYQLLEHHILSR